MRIGEILVQLGLLTPEQLRVVLDGRDLLGARIGTQIVERGLLDTDQISEALGRQTRMPAALQRHFDKADPAVVALLKPNLAARYVAIPLVAARSGVKRIVVAMATPQDMLVVDDVSFALGARVEPMISSELAMARNLKRLYGVEVNLNRPARPEPPPGSRSASREIQALAHSATPQMPSLQPPATAAPPPLLAPPPGAAVSLEDAVHRLSVSEHRDQIADILIDFMLPRFGCGLIFLLKGAEAQAWRGYAPGVDSRAIETIAFPMSIPSMFHAVKEHAASFRGAPPAEGQHLHAQVWKFLQCQQPAEVMVIPVSIAERVVILVYVHAHDGGRLPEHPIQELQAMCNAAGSSFIRLIQQARDGQKPTTLLPR